MSTRLRAAALSGASGVCLRPNFVPDLSPTAERLEKPCLIFAGDMNLFRAAYGDANQRDLDNVYQWSAR